MSFIFKLFPVYDIGCCPDIWLFFAVFVIISVSSVSHSFLPPTLYYLLLLDTFILWVFFLSFVYICSYSFFFVPPDSNAKHSGDRGFSTNLKSLHLTAENASLAMSSDIGSTQTIGELIFGYVIPFSLDLAGYVSAIVCCKFIDQEQLQNLIERTFLMSMQPKLLCRVLWLHILVAFIIFGCLYAYVVPVVVMQPTIIKVKWLVHMETDLRLSVKVGT